MVLAAGLGKRMQSELPKALARTSERTLIEHVLLTCSRLNPERCVVVTGHRGELVRKEVQSSLEAGRWQCQKLIFAHQEQQRGTGDAVRSALAALEGFTGTVLIVCGDMPLVREQSLRALLDLHVHEKATLSLITLRTARPESYGRILRAAPGGRVIKIVEARDCSPEQLAIGEINAAIYAVDSAFLKPAIENLKSENAQGEFYLTDIVEQAANEGQSVSALVLYDAAEIQGVNTRYELALINRALLDRRIRDLLERGVELIDPQTFFIDPESSVAPGAKIGPNVQIRGASSVASGVIIEGCAYIADSQIAQNAHLKLGVRIENASVGARSSVGPFAHLRPGSELGEEVKVGNFVETKKARLEKGAKASHLTYLGDCSVGEEANIGAGTITCNYDGYEKFETVIGRDVFIGSNSALVAPVTIEDGATVGAGSVITKDVEKDSLAFTRAPQVAKPGWSKSKRERAAAKKTNKK